MSDSSTSALVLLVDDETAVTEMYSTALQSAGHLVACAANGQEALTLIKTFSFDAVVSDVRMPVMNGLELLSILEERHPRLVDRFMFITGWLGDLEDDVNGSDRPVLEKPTSLKDFVAAVERLASVEVAGG